MQWSLTPARLSLTATGTPITAARFHRFGGANMFWSHPHHCGCEGTHPPYCPFPQWTHPLLCNPAHLCCAENDNGPTLVIHQILLEP